MRISLTRGEYEMNIKIIAQIAGVLHNCQLAFYHIMCGDYQKAMTAVAPSARSALGHGKRDWKAGGYQQPVIIENTRHMQEA